MAKFTKHATEIDGIATAYLTAGKGKPLVYLHGEDTFPGVGFAGPWTSRFSVIAPFHPGFGDSADDPRIEDMDDYVLHYLDLFDALKLERFSLVGHGFGGWIAAKFASLNSHRVERLVLACPMGLRIPAHPGTDRFKIAPEKVPELLTAKPAIAKRMLPKNPDVEFRVSRYREATALSRIVWEWPYDKTLARWLRRIGAPTLIVWGAEDKLTPVQQAKVWAGLIPGAKVARIAGAGHLPFHENAKAAARAADFLAA
jgi:pimeloyl-ACP methyl ester carboxylesterase